VRPTATRVPRAGRAAGTTLAACVLLALSAGTLADPGKTRAQVQAELAAAEQAGEIHQGETGVTPREAFPWLYPADPASGPSKTRAQVRAEYDQALALGEVRDGLAGLTPRELFPGDYPALPAAPGKTRAQIRAELATAQREGMVRDGLAGLTPRELFPSDYATPARPAGIVHTVAHATGDPHR
jgi:hypothetical protein